MALPSTLSFLLLDVGGTPCALPGESVREVLPLPRLHVPPATGGPLAGFLDLGGRPVPAIDLAALLGLRVAPDAADPYRHLALSADGETAYLVDRVRDHLRVAPEAVRPVADARTLNGCVGAEIAHDGQLVHVLSPARLLTAEERARIAALGQRAAARLASLPEA